MKPWEQLGETRTPDGDLLTLSRRDREYVIHANGRSLMSSLMHGSEEALAAFGCHHARGLPGARVLIGGLGMGFTLRATLDALPSDATILVNELLPAVVEWNRGALAALAGHPLADPRVQVLLGDVAETLAGSRAGFDAVLLDVDNGPGAFTTAANGALYDNRGVAHAHAALRAGGVYAVWSSREDRKFEQRLRHTGFDVRVERVRARLHKGGPRHTIFVGRKARAIP